MQLKTALGAVALGVTVLTAVPALVVPQTAAAADCYTSCDPWDNVNDPIVVIGHNPPESDHSGQPWYGGGGGSGSHTTAVVVSQGAKWEEAIDDQFKCVRNTGQTVLGIDQNIKYNVSVKVNAGLTAEVSGALKAALGTELNTSVEKSYGLHTSVSPGQSIGVYVEWQTNVYAITTTSSAGQSTQAVNVTAPTGVISVHGC
ncbi:DUF6426 family protein [Streptomyces sp. NPDC096136]|uniref:DUF6426 family protein n=1 Tax=Streptomyces sp. NPDC096136 TaxID=3366076 RepID=UPI00381CB02E